MQVNSTHGADVITGNFAEEELRTVGDGLPCTQRVNVLLPVFNLRQRDGETNSKRDERSTQNYLKHFSYHCLNINVNIFMTNNQPANFIC